MCGMKYLSCDNYVSVRASARAYPIYDIPSGHYLKHVVGCFCVYKYIGIYIYSCSFVLRGVVFRGLEAGVQERGQLLDCFSSCTIVSIVNVVFPGDLPQPHFFRLPTPLLLCVCTFWVVTLIKTLPSKEN